MKVERLNILKIVVVLTLVVMFCFGLVSLAQAGSIFLPKQDYIVGDYPIFVAIGDFNEDQAQDLAVANSEDDTVSILIGNGDGTFNPPENYGAGDYTRSIGIGDFNEDEHQDLAVANTYSNNVSIFIGNGDGTFDLPVNYEAGNGPTSIAIGDFNEDQAQDLVITNFFDDNVSILIGNGDGTFNSPVNYSVGIEPVWVAIGDFNEDGHQDFAIANHWGWENSVSILIGNGDGTFDLLSHIGEGWETYSVAIGDFNEDGHQDLAAGNRIDGNVSIFIGIGDGSFEDQENYPAGNWPHSVTVGDFNRDGHQDLAVANRTDATSVSILIGNGDGTFLSPDLYEVGLGAVSIAVGDFNEDQAQDLAVANSEDDTVSILLNNCSFGSINGRVTDADTGNPIKWALVIAIRKPAKPRDFTGEDGYYEINDLQPGNWLVICIKRGYKAGIKIVKVEACETTTVNFELMPKVGENEDEFPDFSNYPNPFNPDTWIPYYLSQDADVTIRIYNSAGKLVRTLNLGRQVAGIYITKDEAVYWDGKDSLGQPVSSGVYFYTIHAGKFTATRKMVIVK